MTGIRRKMVVWLVGIGSFALTGCEDSTSSKLQGTAVTSQGPTIVVETKKPLLHIRSPQDGDVIYDDVYDGLAGIAFDVPADKRIVVFASDRYSFFVMQPFARHNRRKHIFDQPNCRLATEGTDWKLHVGLAEESAVSYLSACAQRGEWSFSDLPRGIELLDEVRVERRKR